MATIVFGGYMVRYPLGGMLSNTLEYLVGFAELGHDVVFIEKAGYRSSCFDPVRNVMTDDPRHGIEVVRALFERFGLQQWCYIAADGEIYGMSRQRLQDVLRKAELFVDYGAHGSWAQETTDVPMRVLIDGEPGYRQIALELGLDPGREGIEYDRYFTNGMSVGSPGSPAPTAGQCWEHLFHPVNLASHASVRAPVPQDPFTTIMNWQSHAPIEFRGRTYGQKDVEFERFIELPQRVGSGTRLEVAVSGAEVPTSRLVHHGWHIRDAHEVTHTYDSFIDYIDASAGEFTVCKNVFVALRTGWFSDRSAVYLARGRPVVMQDTGFSRHLPTGEGLFAVDTVDQAASALDEIARDPVRHSAAAKEIAREHLAADQVLGTFLSELGIS